MFCSVLDVEIWLYFTVLLLFFQFGFLFISFSSLITVAGTFKTMLNNSGKPGWCIYTME